MQTNGFNIDFFWVVSTGLILVLSVLSILIIYTYQQKRLKYNREILKLKNEHEKDLLEAQLEMQEITFQNIAHEIHDNIIHAITLASMQLSQLDPGSHTPFGSDVNNIKSLLNEAIFDLHNVSKGLNREVIEHQGLLKALDLEITRLKRLNLFSIHLSVIGEAVFLEQNKELILFRIIQESIQNIIKHAKATQVNLMVNYQLNSLTIKVIDNGRGFPSPTQMEKKSLSSGIKNIRKRISALHGDLSIDTSSSGTIISLLIPLIYDSQ